jgi:hypothetical protein
MKEPKTSTELAAGKLSEAMLSAQDAARRHDLVLKQAVDSLGITALRTTALDLGSGVRQALENIDRNREMIRAALGPLEELRRSGVFDSVTERFAELSQASRALGDYTARFQLPDLSETVRLFQQFETSGLATTIRRYQDHGREIQRAMQTMRTPWLDMQNRLQSFGSFAELQNIGIALHNLPAFDEKLVDQLRIALGDWRGAIDWPDNIFSDALARSTFYVGKGFDPRLTDFPADAFRQSVGIAGLAGEPAPLLGEYEGEGGDDDEEALGFERTNAAHDRLLRFETQLRKFIENNMRAAFGEDWIRQRVPGEIWQRWHEKRELARERGETMWPLIAYADFTDYAPIITRKDNWETLFKPLFRRAEFVNESFQRLYPIRICTMHARIITQDDELYLFVEIKRLLTAIGIKL